VIEMETTLHFHNKTVGSFDEDYWHVRVNIRGTPKVVEQIKDLIREHMKKQSDAEED